jgi:uncharacterized protein (TIGR02186 family)
VRIAVLLALALLPLAAPAAAQEEVIADLSQNRVSITADFVGSEILVFGAVKREVPIVWNPLGVIVVVAGPSEPVVVRRKTRVAGIWVNTAAVEIDRAPSFYAVSTSGPLEDILLHVEDLRYRITPRRAIRSVGAPADVLDSPEFTSALIRVREAGGVYKVDEGAVSLSQQTLFSTSVQLPSNLVEGNYAVRIYLTRDRRVVTTFHTEIFVQKVGLERFLYTLAHEQPFLYGLMALALAVGAGWGASTAFRMLRT